MVDRKLIDYIKSALFRGIPLNQIKKDLLSKGWPPYDIDYAIGLASSKNFSKTKEESSKLWIIPVLVIVFLITTGIFMYFSLGREEGSKKTTLPETKQNTDQLTSSAIIECGTDMNCLIDSSKKCVPSKLTNNVTLDFFGMLITTTSFYEIKGTEANKCVLYMKTENQDIDFSEELTQQMLDSGVTQEEIEQQKQESNKQNNELVKGLDGTCKFGSNSDLTNLLRAWKDGNFSSSDLASTDCEGKIFGTDTESELAENSDSECKIKMGTTKIELYEGVGSTLGVSGFKGSPEEVSWKIENSTIASVNQSSGTLVMLEAKKKGLTKIIVTDNAVGVDCTNSIDLEVTSYYN